MDSASSRDKLAWDAFRYVSEEMSPLEQAAFESRLDGDQTAREAVAEVVRLSGAVRAVEGILHDFRRDSFKALSISAERASGLASLPRPRMTTMATPVGWMALGAAASLAMVLIAQSWISPMAVGPAAATPEGTGRATGIPSDAGGGIDERQVALAWSENSDEADSGDETDATAADASDDLSGSDLAGGDAAVADGDATSNDDASERDWDTPSWLSAGLTNSEPDRAPLPEPR